MLAKNMDAVDALKFGLADGTGQSTELPEMTAKLAERLARISPTVMAEIKRGLLAHLVPLTEAMTERDAAFDHFVGDDFLGEGLAALVERRFANFKR
jgi:enoyl-CoA hydratase/carnithine racemase